MLFLLMISFTPSWKCAAHLSSVHSRRVGIFSGESCSICVSLPYVLVYRCATMLKEMYWNVSHSVPMYFVSVCMCKCLSENGHSSSLQELGQIMWHNASLFPSFLCPFRYFCHFFISFTVASQTGVQILTVLKKLFQVDHWLTSAEFCGLVCTVVCLALVLVWIFS